MKFTYRLFIFGTILISCSGILAQTPLSVPTDPVPLDPGIRYGRLENGLTYYIRPLDTSGPQVHMEFLVRAGGNQQDADQLDISHAVEHMAFRSGNNYPLGLPNEKERIAKLGIENLRDFGASNGSYATRYTFDAPDHTPYALETALLWFRDIADGLNMLDADIEKERGSLLQEFISKSAYDQGNFFTRSKLKSRIHPGILDQSPFVEHNRSFHPDVLRRYYRDWYRPDLMAISAVGNIPDPELLEAEIRSTFMDVPVPLHPRPWKDTDSLYYRRPQQFAVQKRIEDSIKAIDHQSARLILTFRDAHTAKSIRSLCGLYHKMTWQIIEEVLQARLVARAQAYNREYSISVGYSEPNKSGLPMAFSMTITAANNSERLAVKEALQCMDQMKTFGLVAKEWDRIKAKWIQQLERKGNASVNYWSDEIYKHFVFGEALPPKKPNVMKDWISGQSLKEFNQMIGNVMPEIPDDIGIVAPTGHNALTLSEKEVRSWVQGTLALEAVPYTMPEVPKALMHPEWVAALKEEGYTEKGTGASGAREFVLDNGIHLVLLPQVPTGGKTGGKVMLHGFSPKGASCFSEEDYFSALNAPLIVRNSGAGGSDKFQVKRFLAETSMAGVQPYVDYRESGIKGEAAPRDLEKMLQLVYLYYTAPRKDSSAYRDWKSGKVKEHLFPPNPIGSFDFTNEIKEIMGDSTFFNAGSKQFQGLEKTDMEKAYECYEGLFGNASDFTFVANGAFALDSVLPLFQKYLGNLKNTGDPLKCNVRSHDGHTAKKGPFLFKIPTLDKGTENVDYEILYSALLRNTMDWRESIKVKILAGITNDMVWSLRYDKGYPLYMIMGAGRYNKELARYQLSLKFSTEKERIGALRSEVRQIMDGIRSGDIKEDLIAQNINRLLANYAQESFDHPAHLQNRLVDHYRHGTPWISPTMAKNYIGALTTKDIVETAKKYYTPENQYEFIKGNL